MQALTRLSRVLIAGIPEARFKNGLCGKQETPMTSGGLDVQRSWLSSRLC